MDGKITTREQLREARTVRKLTQKQLAELAGYTPDHVRHLESGVRQITHPQRLQNAFDLWDIKNGREK